MHQNFKKKRENSSHWMQCVWNFERESFCIPWSLQIRTLFWFTLTYEWAGNELVWFCLDHTQNRMIFLLIFILHEYDADMFIYKQTSIVRSNQYWKSTFISSFFSWQNYRQHWTDFSLTIIPKSTNFRNVFAFFRSNSAKFTLQICTSKRFKPCICHLKCTKNRSNRSVKYIRSCDLNLKQWWK